MATKILPKNIKSITYIRMSLKKIKIKSFQFLCLGMRVGQERSNEGVRRMVGSHGFVGHARICWGPHSHSGALLALGCFHGGHCCSNLQLLPFNWLVFILLLVISLYIYIISV